MTYFNNYDQQSGYGFLQPSGTTIPASGQNFGQQGQQQQQQQQQQFQQMQQMQDLQKQAPQYQQFPSYGNQLNNLPGMLPLQQSYVENILRLNKGRLARVYMSFPKSSSWSEKIFEGIIEAAGRDHLILSDPNTGVRWLLLMIYLDYVEFDGEIKYVYP